MDKKEKRKQAGNANVLEVIKKTDGISFIEFKNINQIRSKIAPTLDRTISPWVELSSTKIYDRDKVSKWLLDAIKAEEIHGKVVILWGDYDRPGFAEYAEVTLSENYEWVVPLWQLGYEIVINSFERGYAWNATIFEDRYGFFRINMNEYKRQTRKKHNDNRVR